MAGPIQSAAGRATYAMGSLASDITGTVLKMTGDDSPGEKPNGKQRSWNEYFFGDKYSTLTINHQRNIDIERQAEANRISIEHVKSKQHQQGEFAKRLGAVGTGGEQ